MGRFAKLGRRKGRNGASAGRHFPGHVLAIKYPGTTIDEIGAKFLRYNYFVLRRSLW